MKNRCSNVYFLLFGFDSFVSCSQNVGVISKIASQQMDIDGSRTPSPMLTEPAVIITPRTPLTDIENGVMVHRVLGGDDVRVEQLRAIDENERRLKIYQRHKNLWGRSIDQADCCEKTVTGCTLCCQECAVGCSVLFQKCCKGLVDCVVCVMS